MRRLTIEQFNALEFEFSVELGYFETINRAFYENGCVDVPGSKEEFYFGYGDCTAKSRDVEIRFQYEATGGTEKCDEGHEYELEVYGHGDISIEGAIIVDDDGIDISERELGFTVFNKFSDQGLFNHNIKRDESWKCMIREELTPQIIECLSDCNE